MSVSLREALDGAFYRQWRDPTGLAPLDPQKREAFRTNPLNRDPDDPVQTLAVVDGRIVGRLDLLCGEIILCGEQRRVAWASHMFVHPDFRKRGIGRALLRAQKSPYPLSGACGIARSARSLYPSQEWTCFHLPRYVLVRRSRSLVRSYIRNKPVSRVLTGLGDVALGALTFVAKSSRGVRGLQVTRLNEMPPVLDSRLAACGKSFSCHRSAAWINWLQRSSFGSAPGGGGTECATLHLVERGGGPIGYFVIALRRYERMEHSGLEDIRVGTLQDWRAFDKSLDSWQIVRLAIGRLLDSAADFIVVHATEASLSRRLAWSGFIRASSLECAFALRDEAIVPVGFSDIAKWDIRSADGDNFFN